jgi:hypothetical protein
MIACDIATISLSFGLVMVFDGPGRESRRPGGGSASQATGSPAKVLTSLAAYSVLSF